MAAGRLRGNGWRPAIGAVVTLAVAACSPHRDDGTGLSAEDQRQLNQAAAVLDANSADPPATDAHESSPHD